MTARTNRTAELATGLLLLAVSVLWLARWPSFPLILDPYYHLLIAREVAQAHGPILYDWWQYAPIGRPHVYPPVLHIALAGALRLGMGSIALLRVVSVVIVPALLAMLVCATRRLFGGEAALACLVAALLPFVWLPHAAIAWAASLAMIEMLWMFVMVEQGSWLAAGLLLALMFYTHLGLPWVALATMLGYAAVRPSVRSTVARALWGVVLAVPWLAHLARHAAAIHPTWRFENETVELYPVLYALAVGGAWRAIRSLPAARAWLICAIVSSLLTARFLYRWLNGEGLLAIVVLAGLGLEGMLRWSTAHAASRAGRWLVVVGTALALLAAPTVHCSPTGRRVVWPDAGLLHLLPWPKTLPSVLEGSFVAPPTERVAREVASVTQPGEILWSNAPYAVGLIAALANRAVSSAMFAEVGPSRGFDPIGAAHLVVWIKMDPLPGQPPLNQLIQRYGLSVVGETDLAVLLRNPRADALAAQPRAAIPFWLASVLLWGFLGLIIWTGRQQRQQKDPVWER